MIPSNMNRQAQGLEYSAMISLGALLWLLLSPGVQSQTSSVFASPVSTPMPQTNITYWGLHLGNHVNGEPWTEDLLKRIDGEKPGGIWPSVIVFLSRNLYDVSRNTSGDCRIIDVAGRYPSLTNTGVFTGYLQRASAAGVKIFIRIWPSPGNFDTSHRLSLSPQPFNGNRCDDGSSGQGGNRSYDDIGDEIIKIHQWNATHGISETGFLPANEPNGEWYDLEGLIQRDQLLAWTDMDAYFTAVYTYVHAVLPYPAVSVFTPPMAQEAYAETKDINGCTPDHKLEEGGYGYEKMTKVFMTGASNDGYAWNNYWKVGYEPWTPECKPDVTPHGHHVALWFPVQMINSMLTKPTIITEADLKSPDAPQYGNLANKDDQLGATAATSLERFELAESAAEDIAVWALNITDPTTSTSAIEQNWHEAYRCNDWFGPANTKPPLERPWFTRWWLGETPSYSVAPCYWLFLSGILNNYPEELIKNGHFDAGAAYWSTSRSSSCNQPMVTNFITTTSPAAGLGVCNNNRDAISQTVTIPSNVASARLALRYYIQRPLYVPHIINCYESLPPLYGDCLYLEIVDVSTGQVQHLATHDDNEPGDVWQGDSFDLLAPVNYAGHTIAVRFRAANDQNSPATFWIDDVSLLVTH